MLTLRRSSERGRADHGWLKSFHSLSFADYHDPQHMGFGDLRVINEDRILPGTGFGTHAHRDMEIISYVLDGELAHADSIGGGTPGRGAGGVIGPGEVQRMSAGRGVRHSESNPSSTAPAHFLQIWIEPNVRGIEPEYEQRRFDAATKRGRLLLVASPDGRDESLTLHADASIYGGLFDAGERFEQPIAPGRRAYVHVVSGAVVVNGQPLQGGDALRLEGEPAISVERGVNAELLLFDLR